MIIDQKSLSNFRTCSSVTNSTTVKGPCLEIVGIKPCTGPWTLCFTVFTAQSNAPLYGGSTPGSTFIFITLVLITSIGFEATDATKPATKLAATWVPIPSLSRPFSRIISLAWSYDASCDAVTIIARLTVRPEPRHRLATPSCFDI
uniref:Uncharacterized protein n=1 Tax=Salix viminalis TaxID=40686 RepID=A0A6N2MJQ0_SALVM